MRNLILIAGVMIAMPAWASTCPAAAPFAGWERARPIVAAADFTNPAAIAVGNPVALALKPAAGLRFAVAPGKPIDAGTGGGTVAFAVTTAGRYRIGASTGVWLDVVEAAGVATSVAHGHGPDCGPVRKIVDFDLKPGRHLLQLSGAKSMSVVVMVAPAR